MTRARCHDRMCEDASIRSRKRRNNLMLRVTEPQTETNLDPAADDDAIDVGDDIATDKSNHEACGKKCRRKYGEKQQKLGETETKSFIANTTTNKKARLKEQDLVNDRRGTTERGEQTEPRDNACSPLHQPLRSRASGFSATTCPTCPTQTTTGSANPNDIR